MNVKDFLEQARDGDIVEWKCETLLGKVIRFFTKMDVNHTSTVKVEKGKTRNLEWHITKNFADEDSRKQINKMRKSGIKYELYWFKLKEEYNSYRPKIIRELTRLSKRKYNLSAVIRLILANHKVFENKKMFCSQAVQTALIKVKLLPKNYNKGNSLIPGQLYDTGLFEEPIKIEIN